MKYSSRLSLKALVVALTGVAMLSLSAPQCASAESSKVKLPKLYACVAGNGVVMVRSRCRAHESKMNMFMFEVLQHGAYDVIRSGATIRGVIGGAESAADADANFVRTESIPGVLPMPLINAKVVVANTIAMSGCAGGNCLKDSELLESTQCMGSYAAPSAPAGVVCIYVFTVSNVEKGSVEGGSGPPNTDPNTSDETPGFYLGWSALAAGHTSIGATWAYTAP